MRSLSLFLCGFVSLTFLLSSAKGHAGMQAGAAERDISPPVGMEIMHYFRKNIGVYDPLFLRALVLKDDNDKTFALITADLICAGFAAVDELRARVKKETGVDEVWFNVSHSHASRWLCSTPVEGRKWTDELAWDEFRDRPLKENPEELKWNTMVHRAAVEVVAEAKKKLRPVTLRTGRTKVQVGFNRRVKAPNGSVVESVPAADESPSILTVLFNTQPIR